MVCLSRSLYCVYARKQKGRGKSKLQPKRFRNNGKTTEKKKNTPSCKHECIVYAYRISRGPSVPPGPCPTSAPAHAHTTRNNIKNKSTHNGTHKAAPAVLLGRTRTRQTLDVHDDELTAERDPVTGARLAYSSSSIVHSINKMYFRFLNHQPFPTIGKSVMYEAAVETDGKPILLNIEMQSASFFAPAEVEQPYSPAYHTAVL